MVSARGELGPSAEAVVLFPGLDTAAHKIVTDSIDTMRGRLADSRPA
jgi:hypothetical protein